MFLLTKQRKMRILLLISLLLVVLITVNPANSSRKWVRRLEAPTVVDPRSDFVVMRCDYDLQGKDLYSVYWYKNNKELFKFSPSSLPKGKSFPNESNVNVSISRSNDTHLVLRGHRDDIKKNFETYKGTYRCEVMTERTFSTDSAEAKVRTAIDPKENPVIEGVATNYWIGEQLEAVCTSAPSLPAAELTFYLNNKQVESSLQEYIPIDKLLASSKLKLSLTLEPDDFIDGELNLSCQASLPHIERIYKSEKNVTLGVNQEPYTNISTACKNNTVLLVILFLLRL